MKSVEIYTGAWHGDSSFSLTFPETWDVRVIGKNPGPAMELEGMKQRMLQPIGTERLASLARECASAAIVIDDISRPTPTADLLPLVLDELQSRSRRAGRDDRHTERRQPLLNEVQYGSVIIDHQDGSCHLLHRVDYGDHVEGRSIKSRSNCVS